MSIRGEDRPGSDPKQALFCLALFVKSNTYEYLLAPGDYEIDIQVFSANARASEIFTFYLNHTGDWYPTEADMLDRGLGLRIAKKSSS